MTLLEGYIAKWNKYPTDEVKIRVARPSPLSPSKNLLKDYKEGKITWPQYTTRFINEILSNPRALMKLDEIKELIKNQDVRLLCYEKNPPCHRFILLDMIKEASPS